MLLVLSLVTIGLRAQGSDPWSYNAVNGYRITPNVVYSTANGYDCKLDVYAKTGSTVPLPTVIYIHGGLGWRNKGNSSDEFAPIS